MSRTALRFLLLCAITCAEHHRIKSSTVILTMFFVLGVHAQLATITYADSLDGTKSEALGLASASLVGRSGGRTTYVVRYPEPSDDDSSVEFPSATFIQASRSALVHAEHDATTVDVGCTWLSDGNIARCTTTSGDARPTTEVLFLSSIALRLDQSQPSSTGGSSPSLEPTPTSTGTRSTDSRASANILGSTQQTPGAESTAEPDTEPSTEDGSASRSLPVAAVGLGVFLALLLNL